MLTYNAARLNRGTIFLIHLLLICLSCVCLRCDADDRASVYRTRIRADELTAKESDCVPSL